MSKNVAITVLTWNDWENTTVCLESIFQSDYQNFDVILINNGSDDYHIKKIYEWANNRIKVKDDEIIFNPNKNVEIIEINKQYKVELKGQSKIYLFNLKTNIGLAPAVNIGFKFSLDNSYQYLARIDCDFIITKNYLMSMISVLNSDTDIVAASPKIKHAYLRNTIWWHGFNLTWSYLKFQKTMNLKKKRIMDNPSLKGIIETDAIAGCCSFYNSRALKIVGLEDEDFIFGPEDAELSFRLKKIGKLIVNLDTYTFHKIARSIDVSGWYYRSYNETKGFLMLINKIGTPSDKIFGYLYHLLRIPYFFILLILKKRSKEKVFGFSKGCFDFFFNNN